MRICSDRLFYYTYLALLQQVNNFFFTCRAVRHGKNNWGNETCLFTFYVTASIIPLLLNVIHVRTSMSSIKDTPSNVKMEMQITAALSFRTESNWAGQHIQYVWKSPKRLCVFSTVSNVSTACYWSRSQICWSPKFNITPNTFTQICFAPATGPTTPL